MLKYPVLIAVMLAAAAAPAREKPERWVEVRSPHFSVVSNASEKQARRVADQFERIRSVFQTAFPRMKVGLGSPTMILAVKDEKSFRALEPDSWLGKGQLQRTGVFLRGPENNYILMRLDAGGEHPYRVIYHEYTHFLSSPIEQWLPLWLDEGLAQFYENSEIREKDVLLGEPSGGDIELLRENRLLPLQTLFAVDHSSPYYNEEHKGSIFYAESWALTHYLMVKDFQDKTHRLADYLSLLSAQVNPTAAAERALGDFHPLQQALGAYVRQARFTQFRMATTSNASDDSFTAQNLTPAQADSVRADFMVHDGRYADARSLLDDVLREDPHNLSAHESMGLLESRQGHPEEARKWFEQAVKLNSKSYLANFYFAAIAMQGPLDEETAAQVENSLRTAIKANPAFPSAYDRLAVFYATRREHLDEAHMLELDAIELDPANLGYRLNTGHVLLSLDRPKDAAAVARAALNLAKSSDQLAEVQTLLAWAQKQQAAEELQAEYARQQTLQLAPSESKPPSDTGQTSDGLPPPPVLRHRDEGPPRGTRHVVEGRITAAQCSPPSTLDLKVEAAGRIASLHSNNYFRVNFTAANFTPHGEMHPCTDIQGMQARVVFVAPNDASKPGEIVSIQLSK